MIRRTILFLILIFLLCSCDLSSPEEASKGEIENALYSIELGFNLHHEDEIMQYYDIDYLHSGDDIDDVRLDWQIRLNDYEEMEISDIVIELDGDRATVKMKRRFSSGGEVELEYTDPEDNGDLSYWELKTNGWEIAGNRESDW